MQKLTKENIIKRLKKLAEDAKKYGIPQIAMGINTAIEIIEDEFEEDVE
ncbi:hypothetical protein [Parageobacillus thermoglucosidasius]|nr:hypothetical protein [Parageobacillus thermoglucosidasius]AEH46768.1 hypothetical protein Geoth_0770 [Parageobacillus thermoglucosidasius C56-YS93]